MDFKPAVKNNHQNGFVQCICFAAIFMRLLFLSYSQNTFYSAGKNYLLRMCNGEFEVYFYSTLSSSDGLKAVLL